MPEFSFNASFKLETPYKTGFIGKKTVFFSVLVAV